MNLSRTSKSVIVALASIAFLVAIGGGYKGKFLTYDQFGIGVFFVIIFNLIAHWLWVGLFNHKGVKP